MLMFVQVGRKYSGHPRGWIDLGGFAPMRHGGLDVLVGCVL